MSSRSWRKGNLLSKGDEESPTAYAAQEARDSWSNAPQIFVRREIVAKEVISSIDLGTSENAKK